jgi:hypothetical protein
MMRTQQFRWIAVPTLWLMVSALSGGIRFSGSSEQQVDARRPEATEFARAQSRRHSAELLTTAARRLGSGIVPSIGDSGRIRGFARYSPPLSGPDRSDPELIARRFLLSEQLLLEVDESWIRSLGLVSRDRSGPNSLLRFRQQWSGIPLFQGDLRIHVTPNGEVVEVNSQLAQVPLPPQSTGAILLSQPGFLPSTLTPEDAVLRCVEDLQPGAREFRVRTTSIPEGPQRRTRIRLGPASDEVIAEYVWFPLDGQLRLSWHFDAVSTDSRIYYECAADAYDGTLLYRESITDFETNGLIYNAASPQPSASYGVLPPTPNPPAILSRVTVSFAGDPLASPDGWVGPENETIGNNVTAREDKNGDNDTTLGATAKAVNGSFSFPIGVGPSSPSPVLYTDAAVTNLFYWCNVAHDYFYRLGFTEAAGNFQETNFDRGGIGLDSLRADAQDGIDLTPPYLNNASMSTPADGSRPRMTMYLWGATGGPYVDSDLDAEVIMHEYTHGVFRRLAGGSCGSQCGAMNEGNSDFFGLNYFIPASASPDGDFTQGSFSSQNFTKGTRTRPYSTNLNVNDLTYADFGRVISSGPEVHADGEIWVQAMWEFRARLLKKHGYEQGRLRVAQLMVDALKRSPSNPSYIDMRDALIAADLADYRGADVDLLWEAFARRGMGYMAAGGTGSDVSVIASQELPSPAGRVRFSDAVYYAGEPVRVFIGDSNLQEATLTIRIESLSGDSEILSFTRSGALYQATIPTESGRAVTKNDGILQVASTGDVFRLTYHDTDDGTGSPADITVEARARIGYTPVLLSNTMAAQSESAIFLRGDNTSLRLPLSFSFPYFNRYYNSVYVSTNGLLSFDVANTSSVNSSSALRTYTTIAPLWMDLRTNGTAAPIQEDVYMSARSDRIRFHWIGETARRDASGILIPGNPVDFAVTLIANGDILFEYGAGNQGTTATVGISRGWTTYSRVYSDYSGSSLAPKNLANAQSLIWNFPGNNLTTTVFPFVRASVSEYTGFALLNQDSYPADCLITMHKDGLATTYSQTAYLASGGQYSFVGQQLFPTLLPSFQGWAEVKSTGKDPAAFYVWGDNQQSFLTGAPPPLRLAREFLFPHLPMNSRGLSGTYLYLVNPGNDEANASLRWVDAETAGAMTASRKISAQSRMALDLASLFPSVPAEFKPGYLQVSSDSPLAGVAVSQAGSAPVLVAAQESSGATTLYAAQFANGDAAGVVYATDVSLVNTSGAKRSVSLELVGNDGLTVRGAGITNPRSITMDPAGQFHLGGDSLFGLASPRTGAPIVEGTLIIRADGPGIAGDVTFGEATRGQFTATLPLDGMPSSDQIFAHVAEGTAGAGNPYFTGMAAFNPNEKEVLLEVQIFNRKGILVGKSSLTLNSRTRIARTVGQLFPGLTQVGGYIRIAATAPVTSFALYGDSGLAYLVALPPQRLD